MRVILHIGQERADAAGLQAAFTAAAGALLRAGILYPIPRRTADGPYAHTLLGTCLDDAKPGKLNRTQHRELNDIFRPEEAFDQYGGLIEGLVRAHRPETVVLSADYLFRPVSETAATRLRRWLLGLRGDLSVAAYVRRPSARYLSGLHQRLRVSPALPAPGPVAYRPVLEAWRAGFGERLKVIAWDGPGDIVADFAARFVPGAAEAGLRADAAPAAAPSAELMAILQDFMTATGSAQGAAVEAELQAPLPRLGGGPEAARLRPEVAAHIDRASPDAGWLRDMFGAVFEAFPYDAPAAPPWAGPETPRVCDLCVVDEGLMRRIVYSHLDRLLRNDRKARAAVRARDAA
ncbi:MAG: hypothetical protein IT548_05845 [Alphaproteobacteria bacterium]|nr:hypothetical protein [Alphaproteobacteria bacterium]